MKTRIKSIVKTIVKLLMATSLVMVISCSKDSATDLTQENLTATNAKGGKQVTRPVKNNYVGIDRPDGSGSDFTGNMSHVGKMTGSTYTTAFIDNLDGTYTLTSDDVINAANGDQIFTSSEVIIVPSSATDGSYYGGFDITGGTGRFDGATGRMEVANGSYSSGRATHNAVGTITY